MSIAIPMGWIYPSSLTCIAIDQLKKTLDGPVPANMGILIVGAMAGYFDFDCRSAGPGDVFLSNDNQCVTLPRL